MLYAICGVIMKTARNAGEFVGTIDFGALAVREDELEALARRCRERAVRELIVEGRRTISCLTSLSASAMRMT
jgi:hypothetical protein